MYLLKRIFLAFSCFFILCRTQTYSTYPEQNKYSVASTKSFPYYDSISDPLHSNSYYKYLFRRNVHSSKGFNRNPVSSATSSYPFYSSSVNKEISSNSHKKENVKATLAFKQRISKADAENAKFAGAANQENDDFGRTAFLKRKLFRRRFGGTLINPCFQYSRHGGSKITPNPKEQGRFLWGINVYNAYPQPSIGLGCGHYGGFGTGLGGVLRPDLLSDPISPAYYPSGSGIANFLGLFAPGILQNSLGVTAPFQQFADYGQQSTDDLQNDPEVDPNYRPEHVSVPVRTPNRVLYDSAGAPPVTPAQLVGGISTTVNGIIQQLTGNVQPVYG